MAFGQPLWLWAWAVIPLLVALFIYNESRRQALVRRVVATRLEPQLAASVSSTGRIMRFILILAGLAGVIGALAQPRWGYTWEESKRRGRDILIAVDVSKSMLATDLTPTRLGRAKLAVQDLIGQLSGDRVGLIAFAGTAFLQAPLTVDHSAVLNAVQELDTEIIPLGGTNIAAAIRTARDAFGKGESDHRALIIFTDGEELEDDAAKVAERIKENVRIFTVGLGSNDGSLIPLVGEHSGEFVKDAKGQIVKSRVDEERLTTIAESTGGFYIHLLSGRADIDRLVHDGLGEMNAQDIDAKLSRQPIERYHWPLGFGLAALLLSTFVSERRRVGAPTARSAVTAGLCALFAFPLTSSAKNDGVQAYAEKDYNRALKAFTEQLGREPRSPRRQFNVGSAAYQKGDLEAALEAFSQALTSPDPALRAKAEYNLGNTLFQRGAAQKKNEPKIQDWRNALEHYEQALKVEPKNEDAAYNAEIVRKMLAELEKQQEQQQQQQQEEEKKKQKNDKQQQQNKNDKQQSSQQNQQQKKDGGKNQPQDQQQQQQGEGEDQQEQSGNEKQKNDPSAEKKKEQEGKEAGEKEQPNDGKEPPDKPQNGEAEPSEPKKEGELKNAPEYGDKSGDKDEGAPIEEAAEVDGKMSPAQARALLDSLKSEDDRVQLLNPRDRKIRGRVLRDW
jgi:Ca-activated chloride channel family protein